MIGISRFIGAHPENRCQRLEAPYGQINRNAPLICQSETLSVGLAGVDVITH